MIAVQLVCARIGMVCGVGLSGALRRHYPRALLVAICVVLVAANVFNYFGAAVLARPQWGEVVHRTLVPDRVARRLPADARRDSRHHDLAAFILLAGVAGGRSGEGAGAPQPRAATRRDARRAARCA